LTLINELLTNKALVPVLFLSLFVLMIVFLMIQSSINRATRTQLMKSLSQSQEKLFANAAEILARKLIEYTDVTLVEKVNANYKKLTMEELLPAVNAAAKMTAELSDAVVQRQETGMAELAEKLADLLAAKTSDYIREEHNVIANLHQSTYEFSERLTGITTAIELISSRYTNVYAQANVISETVSEAVGIMSGKFSEFSAMLDNTSRSVEAMQANMMESNKTASTLSEAAKAISKTANESAVLLATQNEKTAGLLYDAVHSMQQNTDLASKAVLSEFGSILSTTQNSMENTVETLQLIAEKINDSASQFANGIASTYESFGNSAQEKFSQLTKEVARSSELEYQRIIQSAESYSTQFTNSVTMMNDSLEGHITNLQTITRHLDNSLSSFKDDADTSSDRFALGIEKTVSDTLKEIDSALAEIVKRLISVTVSIEEAADALPKAVKAIKESY